MLEPSEVDYLSSLSDLFWYNFQFVNYLLVNWNNRMFGTDFTC